MGIDAVLSVCGDKCIILRQQLFDFGGNESDYALMPVFAVNYYDFIIDK